MMTVKLMEVKKVLIIIISDTETLTLENFKKLIIFK
jgi:hypothetical protein